jgi:hypothetical protein
MTLIRDLIIIALLILVTVLCGLHSMVSTVNDREKGRMYWCEEALHVQK